MEENLVPTCCTQCQQLPCYCKIRVRGGVAVGIEPNYDLAWAWTNRTETKVCARAYGLIQKHYSPHRVKAPQKRTNPRKGIDEDPRWQEITWDEALETVAKKLSAVRKSGLLDENGYPKIAWAEGSPRVSPYHYGTLLTLFGARRSKAVLSPVDSTLSIRGRCMSAARMLGELWHKGGCTPDTPYCSYQISFGKHANVTAGAAGILRHADSRTKGSKRVQIEPHLSATGATASKWIPIKPETDHTFLYAVIHTILHEMDWQAACDTEFLKKMTNSPYLVAPNGFFARDKETRKPLIWDSVENKAKIFDAADIKDFALLGEYPVKGLTVGPDEEIQEIDSDKVKTSFQLLMEHMKGFSPEWAADICDIGADTIRKVAAEFVENAMVGATIRIQGIEMPHRPVAITVGKSVNHGWGATQFVWAQHVLESLVGAIEVPGGELGLDVNISGPMARTNDGFLEYPFNPTDKKHWDLPPGKRDPAARLCPLVSTWSGAFHLSWKWLVDCPPNWPKPSIPEVMISFRHNPVLNQFDTPAVIEVLKRMPFQVAFVHSMNETAWFADLLLPEDGELETLQLLRFGATGHTENYRQTTGFVLKQPVVQRVGNTMNVTDIATEIADRLGMLDKYNEDINTGGCLGIRLKGTPWELKQDRKYSVAELYDRLCRAVTSHLSHGEVEHGLDWFKQNGAFLQPYANLVGVGAVRDGRYERPRYLYPAMKESGFRFELPYQERLKRIGSELKERLLEKGIDWWDRQADAHQALPEWTDVSAFLDEVYIKRFGKYPGDYPFWLLTARSALYAWGSNAGVPLMHEAASLTLADTGVQLNKKTAERLGIKDEDEIWIESPFRKMKGKAKTREGIRPDCLLVTGMHGHWLTPFAKDLGIPNVSQIVPSLIELTDDKGAEKEHVKVKIYKA